MAKKKIAELAEMVASEAKVDFESLFPDLNRKNKNTGDGGKTKSNSKSSATTKCCLDHSKFVVSNYQITDDNYYFKQGRKCHGFACLRCNKVAKSEEVNSKTPWYLCLEIEKENNTDCKTIYCLKCHIELDEATKGNNSRRSSRRVT